MVKRVTFECSHVSLVSSRGSHAALVVSKSVIIISSSPFGRTLIYFFSGSCNMCLILLQTGSQFHSI